jgi:hypothetical protein
MNKVYNIKLLTLSFLALTTALMPGQKCWADDATATKSSTQENTPSDSNEYRRSYLGLLLGGDTSNDSDLNNAKMTFGVTLGSKIIPEFGLGVLLSYRGQTSSGSVLGLPAGVSTNTYTAAAQGNFFLGGFHFGGEVGPSITSWSGNVSSLHTGSSATSLVYGPEAGFDFKIVSALSVGIEAHYLFSSDSNNVNNLEGFVGLKLWQ